MNFNLDDIYALVVRNKRHIHDFSLESFERICKENIQVLEDLISFSQSKCEEINDEKIKKAVSYGIKNNLVRSYNYMKTTNPKKENASEKQSKSYVGYFIDHPEAFYLQRRFPDLRKSYS